MAIDQMDEEKDKLEEELGALSPLMPPKQKLDPPEGYFDGLPTSVIERWKQNQLKGRLLIIRRWITVAAVSAGIMLVGWWFLQSQRDSSSPAALVISNADAYQYVLDNIGDFEGLVEQQLSWPMEEYIIIPDSSAAEEYLLEELQGHELEQIF